MRCERRIIGLHEHGRCTTHGPLAITGLDLESARLVKRQVEHQLLRNGDAFQGLKIVAADRDWNEQAARKQLLTIFEAAGPTSEIARDGRRRLSSILFA